MLNRVVTNGNVIDVGTSKEDGSFIVSVPNKALFKVGTDGKINIDSIGTKLLENGVDRVDKLRLELADILSELSKQMDTIITDSGSSADTTDLNTMIDNLKNI